MVGIVQDVDRWYPEFRDPDCYVVWVDPGRPHTSELAPRRALHVQPVMVRRNLIDDLPPDSRPRAVVVRGAGS